jgi:hypothetical protein
MSDDSHVTLIQYAAVLTAGAGVGLCELLVRFKDDPLLALQSTWAWLYIGWNALGSGLALALILYVPFTFGAPINSKLDYVLTALVAGFGAMAFLRSSFFVAKVGDKDVPVGAALVLQTILDTLIEAVERERIPARAAALAALMSSMPLDKAAMNLPAYLFSLKTYSPALQAELSEQIKKIAADQLQSDPTKVAIIGQLLMRTVGLNAFKAAVQNCPD